MIMIMRIIIIINTNSTNLLLVMIKKVILTTINICLLISVNQYLSLPYSAHPTVTMTYHCISPGYSVDSFEYSNVLA